MNQKFKSVNRQKIRELVNESKEITRALQTILERWNWTEKPDPNELLSYLEKAKEKIPPLSQKIETYQAIAREIIWTN